MAAARDPEIQALLDKQAIREVVLRYCRGIDRLDREMVRDCYWPEAIDEHGSFAMLRVVEATPVKPNRPATTETMKKMIAHLIMPSGQQCAGHRGARRRPMRLTDYARATPGARRDPPRCR